MLESLAVVDVELKVTCLPALQIDFICLFVRDYESV